MNSWYFDRDQSTAKLSLKETWLNSKIGKNIKIFVFRPRNSLSKIQTLTWSTWFQHQRLSSNFALLAAFLGQCVILIREHNYIRRSRVPCGNFWSSTCGLFQGNYGSDEYFLVQEVDCRCWTFVFQNKWFTFWARCIAFQNIFTQNRQLIISIQALTGVAVQNFITLSMYKYEPAI